MASFHGKASIGGNLRAENLGALAAGMLECHFDGRADKYHVRYLDGPSNHVKVSTDPVLPVIPSRQFDRRQ